MTYNSGVPIPPDKQVYKTSTPFIAEIGGRVVGTFVVMDMNVTRGMAAEFKTGGIAGVAVLPEARHTGVGSEMMKWALRHMRSEGYILAALYAFRESYYRRFGYEVCGLRMKVHCNQAQLPRTAPSLPIRKLPAGEYQEIVSCYEKFARSRSGANLRDAMHWGRVVGEKHHIYVAGDPVEAYVIVEHDWTFWQEQDVHEIGWSSARGYESILSLIRSVAINKTAATWFEPSDGPMASAHLDTGVELTSEKPVMFRLLNAAGALLALRTQAEGDFSFAIVDPDLPENNGPWKVCFGDGRTDVRACDAAALTLTPHVAVQALLGQPSLDSLAGNGLIEGPAEALSAASRLLPAASVYCLDFF